MPEENLPTEAQTIEELKAKADQLQKEKDEYLESLKRAKNDLFKYKQDEARRAEEIMAFSNKTLILMLLPVLDSFDLALKLTSGDSDLRKGLEMIKTQLETALRSFGLEIIKPKVLEEKANAQVHEVVDKKTCDTLGCEKGDEGLIIEVRGVGYKLHNVLLRPARVKVVTH